MKKFLISLNLIILAHFFTMAPCYCEEAIFIESTAPYSFNSNKVKTFEQQNAKENNFGTTTKKKFFSRKTKQTKFNYSTNKEEVVPYGYYGELPDINADFKYKQVERADSSRQINAMSPMDADLSDDNLKRAPFDDDLFLDVIVKQDKASQYVNDLQKTRYALECLKKCIDEKGSIQRYNGCINLVDMYSKNLKAKYENKSESLKESYIDILNTAYQAKVLGNLMYDSNFYARYIPTQQGKYSLENIELEQQKLLNSVNKTLFLIYQET